MHKHFIAAFIAALVGLSWASVSVALADEPHPERFCESYLKEESDWSRAAEDFDSDWLHAFSVEQFAAAFRTLYAETGACTGWTSEDAGTPGASLFFRLQTTSGKVVKILAAFQEDTGRCIGFRILGVDDPRVTIRSWQDVESALAGFQSNSTASAGAYLGTSDGEVDFGTRADQSFAIGATSKLYVLGALQKAISEQTRAWTDKLAIQDALKSLPSGRMQRFGEGELHELSEYAFGMIFDSDNTATDHLLHLLGRDSVEAMLPVMGMADSSRNLPFLSTRELFQLKWGVPPSETQAYIDADAAHRRELLTGLAALPLSQVGHNGVSMEEPTRIRELGWFASPRENCKAIQWLAGSGSDEVRRLLHYHVPMLEIPPRPHWSYSGFKGGSEPGVLNATYVMETASGKRACLAVSWNDTEHTLARYRFFDVVEKTLRFAESVVR